MDSPACRARWWESGDQFRPSGGGSAGSPSLLTHPVLDPSLYITTVRHNRGRGSVALICKEVRVLSKKLPMEWLVAAECLAPKRHHLPGLLQNVRFAYRKPA